MRQSLTSTFDDAFILDLHGNSKRKEVSPDETKDENIFDIQQGVAVTFLSKYVSKEGLSLKHPAFSYHELWGLRGNNVSNNEVKSSGKYQWLNDYSISDTPWQSFSPENPFYLFAPQDKERLKEYEKGWKIDELFITYSSGIISARESLAISFSRQKLWEVIKDFSSLPVEVARSQYNLRNDTNDWKVDLAQ